MPISKRCTIVPAAVVLLGLSGCYEYEQEPVATQSPAAAPGADGTAPAAGSASGQADARPSHAGARQAAHNTVEKLDERQREIEKALEDDND